MQFWTLLQNTSFIYTILLPIREKTTDKSQQTDENPKTRYVISSGVISYSVKVNGVKQSMPVDYTLPNHDKKVCSAVQSSMCIIKDIR